MGQLKIDASRITDARSTSGEEIRNEKVTANGNPAAVKPQHLLELSQLTDVILRPAYQRAHRFVASRFGQGGQDDNNHQGASSSCASSRKRKVLAVI